MWSVTGVPQLTRRPDAKFGWLYPAALMEGAKKRALENPLKRAPNKLTGERACVVSARQ